MLNKFSIIIAFVLVLSGCSSNKTDRYYNKKDDFSIKFPKDWENKEGFMGTDVISLSPLENTSDRFRENVNVVVEPLSEGMNINEYFTENINKLSKIVRDFQEKETGTSTINDNNAQWLIYTGSIGTVNLKSKQYYMIHDNKGYVITFSATPETYDAYNSKFEIIVNSFEFE